MCCRPTSLAKPPRVGPQCQSAAYLATTSLPASPVARRGVENGSRPLSVALWKAPKSYSAFRYRPLTPWLPVFGSGVYKIWVLSNWRKQLYD